MSPDLKYIPSIQRGEQTMPLRWHANSRIPRLNIIKQPSKSSGFFQIQVSDFNKGVTFW